jgi:hypothetical protein
MFALGRSFKDKQAAFSTVLAQVRYNWSKKSCRLKNKCKVLK